jgi:hypothetical protein
MTVSPAVTTNVFDLRQLADIYESTVKVRIAAENRLRAISQGFDEGEKPQVLASNRLVEILVMAEEEAENNMKIAFREHPCFDFMMGVPGVNAITACRILGMIGDATMFARFSNLRTFAGMTPGKDRLVKGEKAVFCKRLKTNIHILFDTMLKSGSRVSEKNRPSEMYTAIYAKWRGTYAERYGFGDCKHKQNRTCKKPVLKDGKNLKKNGKVVYQTRTYSVVDKPEGFDEWIEVNPKIVTLVFDMQKNSPPEEVEEYVSTLPYDPRMVKKYPQDWSDLRQHLAAKRKMMDVFLYHLYEEWLTRLDKQVPGLYVHDVLGHHMKYDRDKFQSDSLRESKIKKFNNSIH